MVNSKERFFKMLKRALELVTVFVLICESASRHFHCVNDFDRTMMCKFTPGQPVNCSEYSLNVVFLPNEPYHRRYGCSLKNTIGHQCDCTIEVEQGFLFDEDSNVTLIRNGSIQGKPKIIYTTHSIKPKTPTIMSVTQTTAGKNYRVTWRTNYEESNALMTFKEKLGTELHYKAKNTDTWRIVHEDAIHKTNREIMGLEPNTEYIIKARVFYPIIKPLNFSDWSEEFRFDTLVSGEDVTKKVVPILCVILLCIICTLACCYVKIKKEWSSKKFSAPDIGTICHPPSQEYMILHPEKIQTSPMVVDILKTDTTEEEKSITVFSVSGSSGNFSNTESTKSTPGDYGLACHDEDQKDTQILERVRLAFKHDMEQARQIPLDQVPKTWEYEGIQSQESERVLSPSHGQSTSGSSFNNRCYSPHPGSSECQSSFFTSSISSDHGYQSDESVGSPVLDAGGECDVTLTPLIQTELDYRSCDGCVISKVEPLSQLTGGIQLFTAGEADERFAKAGGQGLSVCVDQGKGKDCLQGVVWGKDLLQPGLTQDCGLILCEDDYRPFSA